MNNFTTIKARSLNDELLVAPPVRGLVAVKQVDYLHYKLLMDLIYSVFIGFLAVRDRVDRNRLSHDAPQRHAVRDGRILAAVEARQRKPKLSR